MTLDVQGYSEEILGRALEGRRDLVSRGQHEFSRDVELGGERRPELVLLGLAAAAAFLALRLFGGSLRRCGFGLLLRAKRNRRLAKRRQPR